MKYYLLVRKKCSGEHRYIALLMPGRVCINENEKNPSALRSRMLSKLIFARCV